MPTTVNEVIEDLVLYDSRTRSLLGTVFTSAGNDANGNPLFNDGSGNPITLEQVKAILQPAGLYFEPVRRLYGTSIKDLLDRFGRGELQTVTPGFMGAKVIEQLYKGWQRLVSNPNMSPAGAFISLFDDMPTLSKVVDYLRPLQEAQLPKPSEIQTLVEQLGLTDRPLDFQNSNLEAAGLFKALKEKYLESVFGDDPAIHTTEWKLLEGGWVWALEEMHTALVNGDPIDTYLEFPEIQSFWSGIESNVTFRVPEGETVVEDEKDIIASNLESIIKKYQAIHGADSRDEIVKYLQDYASEFDWAKMDEAITVDGTEGMFPSMLLPEDIVNFDNWLSEREKEAAEVMSEEDRELRHQQIVNSVMAIYENRYGPAGRNLGQLALNEAIANATDGMLVSVGEVRTPDSSLATYVPSDVRDIFNLTGVAPNDYLNSLRADMTPESAAAMYRNLAVGTALTNIQSGRLAPEVVDQLKSVANTAIMQGPAPGGERKFFLLESAAQEQFRTYLAGNLPAGTYRNTAWEYFPQTWKNFPGQHELGAGEKFEEHMAGLGPTFFARLTPKPERVSAPTRVRPPGGGRLPMR